MIKTMGFQEHVFPGKAQICALYKDVLIAGVLQDVAQQILFGKKLETDAEALPSNGANSGMPHCEATMPAMV